MQGGTATKLARVPRAFQRGDNETAVLTFARAVLGEQPFQRFSDSRKQQMLDNAGTLRALMLGAGPPDLSDDEVRRISVPTLLISGELSPGGVLLPTERLEELLPNAARVCIPDASHLMHEENARAVNEAVLSFLGRVGTHR